MNKPKNYILAADIIRAVAIALVVVIHTFNMITARLDFFGSGLWWVSTILMSVARISIPLFIMLSGYLLLRKCESIKQSIKRTLIYIIIPLLFWLMFYLVWNDAEPSIWELNTFINRLITGGAIHLYFLLILAGLYFVTPMIQALITNHSRKSVAWYAFLFLIVGALFSIFQYLFGICYYQTSATMWVPYIGLFMMGYVLGTSKHTKNRTKQYISMFALGLISTTGLTYYHMYMLTHGLGSLHPEGCLSSYPDHYLSIPVLLMSLSSFSLLFHYRYKFIEKSKQLSSLVHTIARSAFGIYVVHIFVIQLYENIPFLIIRTNPIGLMLLVVFKWSVVFFVSLGITIIGMQIPYVKYLFGARTKLTE